MLVFLLIIVAAAAPAPASANGNLRAFVWVSPGQSLGTYTTNEPGFRSSASDQHAVFAVAGGQSPELGSCSPSGSLLAPFAFASRPNANSPLVNNADYLVFAGTVDGVGAASFVVQGIQFTGTGSISWTAPPSPVYGTNLLVLDATLAFTGTDASGNSFSYTGSSGVYVVQVVINEPGIC